MSLDQSIVDALLKCRQKLHEALFSYNNYITTFDVYCDLKGYAKWSESMRETKANLIWEITDYLTQNNIQIPQLQDPVPPSLSDPIEILNSILKNEIICSISLETAFRLPALEDDEDSYDFIIGLVEEQVEEEATASELLDRTKVFYLGPPSKFGLDLIDDALI